MADQSLPSPDLLRKVLDYDPVIGSLVWRKRAPDLFYSDGRTSEHKANNWNSRWAGKPAFTGTNNSGYNRGPCLGAYVLAHRVIWAMVTGAWPTGQIDHINGVRTDNRWINLREADHTINGRNARKKSNNTSGHNGVWWFASRNKWCAQITIDCRNIKLGYFDSIEEAVAARKSAEAGHGFTDTHGSHR